MSSVPETSNPTPPRNFSSPAPKCVVVGMGGNQGDVRRRFGEVIEHFHDAGQLMGVSSLYRSAPVGPAQPDFLNAALSVDASAWLENGTFLPLLTRLQALEAAAKRVRVLRWGPRTLDLDILWAGEHQESAPELTIPHPRLVERRFALLPLLDLLPEARLPPASVTFSSVLSGIVGDSVEKIDEGSWWEAQPHP